MHQQQISFEGHPPVERFNISTGLLSSAEPFPLVSSAPVILKEREAEVRRIERETLKLELKYDLPSYLAKFDSTHVTRLARLKELQEMDSNNGVSAKDTIGYFITVNPEFKDLDLDHVLSVLIKCTEKFVRKKAIAQYLYCYEQSNGSHPHAHILIILDKTNQASQPSKFRSGVLSTFKHCWSGKPGPFALNIKPVTAISLLSRIKYVSGSKKKDYDPVPDRKWRLEKGLEQVYGEINV